MVRMTVDQVVDLMLEGARAAVRNGLGDDDIQFSVRAFALENFLFTFKSEEARDRVLRVLGIPAVDAPCLGDFRDVVFQGRPGARRHPATCVEPRHGRCATGIVLLGAEARHRYGGEDRPVLFQAHCLDRQPKPYPEVQDACSGGA